MLWLEDAPWRVFFVAYTTAACVAEGLLTLIEMHLLEVIFASSQAEEAKFGGPKQATDNNAGGKNGASALGCG